MVAQEKNVVKDLIEQGKAKGSLTTSEINNALEDLDFDVEQVDKLYETLENCNVEIIETYAQDIEKDFPPPADEEINETLTVEGISVDDPSRSTSRR